MGKVKYNWQAGLGINLLSAIISFIVGGTVTYFSHEGAGWVKPLLFGGLAWLMTFGSILGWRIMRSLPPKVEPVTSENIGRKVRDWLDRFNLTVQSRIEPGFEFYFVVTTDGGKKITIGRRSGDMSDYLIFRVHANASDDERKLIDAMGKNDKVSLRLAISLELSRAVMGFQSPDAYTLTIFKQIPINSSLSETNIINTLWEVEAAIGSAMTVGQMAALRSAAIREKGGEK